MVLTIDVDQVLQHEICLILVRHGIKERLKISHCASLRVWLQPFGSLIVASCHSFQSWSCVALERCLGLHWFTSKSHYLFHCIPRNHPLYLQKWQADAFEVHVVKAWAMGIIHAVTVGHESFDPAWIQAKLWRHKCASSQHEWSAKHWDAGLPKCGAKSRLCTYVNDA